MNTLLLGKSHRYRYKLFLLKHRYRKHVLGKPSKTIGTTALHFAASRGDYDTVKLLIQAGADPTIESDLGKTALDFAETYGPYPLLRSYLTDIMMRYREELPMHNYSCAGSYGDVPSQDEIDDLLES